MQHGVLEVREQEPVGVLQRGTVIERAPHAFGLDIAPGVHIRKEPHVALHVALLAFGDIEGFHQIGDGKFFRRVRNHLREKLYGPFATSLVCHRVPLRGNI